MKQQDQTKPDTEQGLYEKYSVVRKDGKDKRPYFVLSPSTDPLSEGAQFALKKAEQIAGAIERKLVGYKTYVRHCHSAEYSYIEIGIRKNGDVPANEKQIAYSQQWFEEMTTPEILKTRAMRILNEARIHLGMEQE